MAFHPEFVHFFIMLYFNAICYLLDCIIVQCRKCKKDQRQCFHISSEEWITICMLSSSCKYFLECRGKWLDFRKKSIAFVIDSFPIENNGFLIKDYLRGKEHKKKEYVHTIVVGYQKGHPVFGVPMVTETKERACYCASIKWKRYVRDALMVCGFKCVVPMVYLKNLILSQADIKRVKETIVEKKLTTVYGNNVTHFYCNM